MTFVFFGKLINTRIQLTTTPASNERMPVAVYSHLYLINTLFSLY